ASRVINSQRHTVAPALPALSMIAPSPPNASSSRKVRCAMAMEPCRLHFRQGRAAISQQIYPELDAFFDDLANAYRAVIRAFSDAGCRYLQLDDTAWSMLCDPNERAQSKKRGDGPDNLPAAYAHVTNAALP